MGRNCHMGFAGGTCAQCSPGKYSASRSIDSCIDCEPGRYSSQPGAHQCDVCPMISVNSIAVDGSYSTGGSTICVPWTRCSPLEFETMSGMTSRDRQCRQLTLCDYSIEYESMLATNTSDRICSRLSSCSARDISDWSDDCARLSPSGSFISCGESCTLSQDEQKKIPVKADPQDQHFP